MSNLPAMLKLTSLAGLFVFVGIAWALSSHKRLFPWRTVIWGIALQFAFALVILKTEAGRHVFEWAGMAIQTLIRFSTEGCQFVFGPLATDAMMQRAFGASAMVFAVLVAGTIILVSSLSALLYHWGILQRVVRAIAWLMQKALRTSGSETMSAVANIFMGMTEAPLLVRPYLPRMTKSELLCMMTGGMATIAGGMAAVYAKLGADAGHPNMAGHLLTASVLSAPAALVVSKIMLPETEQSETAAHAVIDTSSPSANSIDALCRGASEGMTLSINVMAMLICFVAVVGLVNFLLTPVLTTVLAPVAGWMGGAADAPVTLQTVAGWVNAPFAWLMGVPAADCQAVGRILGERIVLNELIGYVSLTNPATHLGERSYVLATYALCGFANIGSIAVQVGGIGALIPERRSELARLGMRAMIGGLLASYMTATIAGILW